MGTRHIYRPTALRWSATKATHCTKTNNYPANKTANAQQAGRHAPAKIAGVCTITAKVATDSSLLLLLYATFRAVTLPKETYI